MQAIDNNIKEIAYEMFSKSKEEFLNYPINFRFILDKVDLLNDEEYIGLLIFTLDNFPQLYVIKFILTTIHRILKFNEKEWEILFDNIISIGGGNIICSFLYSYLNLVPSNKYKKNINFNYIYQKDDDDFINTDSLLSLKNKLIKIGFLPITQSL